MTDELVLHGDGLDQPIPLTQDVNEIFESVDAFVEEAAGRQDVEAIMVEGERLAGNIKIEGLSLARLIYKAGSHWSKFGLGETFEVMAMTRWGISAQTVRKYTAIMRGVFENEHVPEEDKPMLAEKPIRTLNRLVRPATKDELSVATWGKIAKAADDSEVRGILQANSKNPKVVGPKPMSLMLYPDGTLYAFEGNKRSTLGVLRTSEEDLKDKLRWKGIQRIRSGAGVLDVT
jgi:hypothetical protein